MIPAPDRTHDPARQSWVESANVQHADFPLQNLPYGVFSTEENPASRIGTAIGDQILDLRTATQAGWLPDRVGAACEQANLNGLLALGPADWAALRARLSELLGAETSLAGKHRDQVAAALVAMKDATMHLPAQIGGYTDFYASVHHAANVGAMFRPDQPLLPNYKWVPIGYHGRTSSIIASETPVRRPRGQTRTGNADPVFGPSQQFDYEIELGAFVGTGNRQGERIAAADAARHLFGVVLLNDWSARDIQSWEYQPLGPFLAKNFATSISPWVVTMEALAPFRVPATVRPPGDPAPLPHLADPGDAARGGLDLTLEVWLRTEKMRVRNAPAHQLSSGNFQSMYWTLAQLLTHHTSNGCNLAPGDLLGSGTVSGPTPGSRGCLLELTARGTAPLELPGDETRGFLVDGDEIILRGWAERPGARRIGLGECRGVVLPAK
jgi:fumarylacetoacetase